MLHRISKRKEAIILVAVVRDRKMMTFVSALYTGETFRLHPTFVIMIMAFCTPENNIMGFQLQFFSPDDS